MQSESKSLAARIIKILAISKDKWSYILKPFKSLEKSLYTAPAKRLENQLRRISNWCEMHSQINQEILKA